MFKKLYMSGRKQPASQPHSPLLLLLLLLTLPPRFTKGMSSPSGSIRCLSTLDNFSSVCVQACGIFTFLLLTSLLPILVPYSYSYSSFYLASHTCAYSLVFAFATLLFSLFSQFPFHPPSLLVFFTSCLSQNQLSPL